MTFRLPKPIVLAITTAVAIYDIKHGRYDATVGVQASFNENGQYQNSSFYYESSRLYMVPLRVDFAENASRASRMNTWEFIKAVRTGGEWDYKKYGRQYEALGNYNYGIVGSATGFTPFTVRVGAGGYQVLSGTSSWEFYDSYFDDRKDQYWINLGISHFNNVYNRGK